MPTGPKHDRDGLACRCMMGKDHAEAASAQSLLVWDAGDVWMSNGQDEGHAFGYSDSELRRALDDRRHQPPATRRSARALSPNTRTK